MAAIAQQTEETGQVDYAIIAQQNDAFRKRLPEGGEGIIVQTTAIDNMGPGFVAECLNQIVTYDGFNEDNDPYGTHEMGFMDIMGHKVCFKIDLYDETYQYGTPAPADLSKTRRVLTILFLSDY
ncbi:DUF3768 domain-containing protein [Ruegeria sp. R14_0]|uniref:DUF3768 domain-containing protein n=1 Tax=Ruegeria sp. R14_0 TaxID=2821100 RepID=UPI001ADC91AB|nr:DUF3768 domain-containing protein [Ruegeria sp. R14_0]MBO9448193.1 DUF3768 domain-containing protein [Ruegeria sp. R14_0]